MNIFEETCKDISSQVSNIVTEATAFADINDFLAKAEKQIANFEKIGSFHIDEYAANIKRERVTNVAPNDESSKENVDSASDKAIRRTTRTAALKDGRNTLNIAKSLVVKLERISEVSPCNDIKDMPPPREPVRRGRPKRGVTVAIKKEQSLSSNGGRDSDVILQPAHVSILSLTDTEEEMKRKPTRSTRTTTRTTVTKKDEIENEKNMNQMEEQNEEAEVKKDVTKIKSSNINAANSIDTGDNVNEKPVRSTRTKTRAMGAKQNTGNEKDLTEKDPMSQPIVESGQVENLVQKVATEESEKVDNKIGINKQSSTSVSSEEGEITKAKKKAKKHTVKRVHNLSPIPNEGKRRKSSEFNKNAKISDETFVKSSHNEDKKANVINQTVVISKPVDVTVTIDKPTFANETVIVPKDKRIVVTTPLNKQVNAGDLITDDEEDRIYSKTTNKKPGKPIFNGFERSPVKKRVEAFEKLGAQQAATSSKPTKITKPKLNRDGEDKSRKDVSLKPTAIKNKVKMFTATPIKNASKLVPFGSQSVLKTIKPTLKDVMLPLKSASALKAYQQDFIDRELRRQEKEFEATRKREALLQAKKDENKRKQEEKQQKVQQAKEALGKTKEEMQDEIDKMQSRKYKQMLAEKSTKVTEQNQEEKKEPIYKTPVKQIKSTPVKTITQKPIYLDMTAPLLPLDDCYDSDDERNAGRAYRPDWTRRHTMYSILRNVSFSTDDVINTFYMRKAATPDLQLLFGRINPNKLKRTSSAIWNKPPRFTIMPIPNEEDEKDIS